MHSKKLKLSLVAVTVIFLSLGACKNKDKYTPINKPVNIQKNKPIPKPESSFMSNLHEVKVNKILKTKRYLYINVTEKGNLNPYWIATRIINVKVGKTYFYKGGLLKTNFKSNEFNRVFNKIYLVSSSLVPANHANIPGFQLKNSSTRQNGVVKINHSKIKTTKQNIIIKGSIRIADLIKNAKKYEGKKIQISGTCTKINAGIMNRNWIHLADGSKDNFDLVVTSQDFVKVGDMVTIKAIVALNQDFGAGYKYSVILEKGIIVH